MFLCATSSWCGHGLTCFAQKVYSQRRLFSLHNFTRDKNGFVLQRISYSRETNKVKTGTLCRILNYSTENLKYRITIDSYLLRIEKKRHFLSKQANTSKEYHCIITGKNVNFYQNTYFARVLWVCPPIIIQITSISQTKRQYFKRAPNFIQCAPTLYYPEHLKFAGKNLPQNTFFYRIAPSGCF